jgi:AcrR family transcriptional regulator
MNTEIQPPPPSKRRKEEILDVATRLFAERGYEGTSMNDVAELVGMRKASLFYHFATKDALYEAVLDRLIASLGVALGRAYGGGGSFSERLDQSVDTLIAVLGTYPYAARLLLREVMDWGPVIRGKLLESMLEVLEQGSAFLRAGQEAGEFVQGDAKQMVISAIGSQFLPFAVGHLVERFVGMQPFTPEFVASRRTAVRRQVRNMVIK